MRGSGRFPTRDLPKRFNPDHHDGLLTAESRPGRILENHPHTKQSFALRRPYLLCLHAIQGEVMARLKVGATDERDERSLNDTMTVSVQGIAAGMQNTG